MADVLVLEIEVPGYFAGGIAEGATFADCTVFDVVVEELMRADVGLTLVSLPSEKSQNHEFEVHAMGGRIVGARIYDDGDTTNDFDMGAS